MKGKQLAGQQKRTSEILLHLAIMKARPDVKSVVHCHPPHATAFAVAREPIPQCVLPEVEVFLGDVPITKYETPGGQEFADTILPFVHKTNVIILANHGTVSYGETVEQAYWWTEILDAYCRMLMLARDLGTRELLQRARSTRAVGPEDEVGLDRSAAHTGNGELRHLRQRHLPRQLAAVGRRAQGVRRAAADGRAQGRGDCRRGNPAQRQSRSDGASSGVDQEALIQTITDRVMAALAK